MSMTLSPVFTETGSYIYIIDKYGGESGILGWTHSTPYRGYGNVPLRFRGNVVRRMGTQ